MLGIGITEENVSSVITNDPRLIQMQAAWPDLAKILPFWQKIESVLAICQGLFNIRQHLNPLWQILTTIEPIFIVFLKKGQHWPLFHLLPS